MVISGGYNVFAPDVASLEPMAWLSDAVRLDVHARHFSNSHAVDYQRVFGASAGALADD